MNKESWEKAMQGRTTNENGKHCEGQENNEK